MSQLKTIKYEIRIEPRQTCAPDKSKYNGDFNNTQSVEANNYFHTLADCYQCYNYTRQEDGTHIATGPLYTVTLTTIRENDETR